MAVFSNSLSRTTLERVESVMNNFKRDQHYLVSFSWKDDPRTGLGPYGAMTGQERLNAMIHRCRLFIDCIHIQNDNFPRMDQLLSQQVFLGLDLSIEADNDPHKVAAYALKVLRRLPTHPAKLPDYDDIMRGTHDRTLERIGSDPPPQFAPP